MKGQRIVITGATSGIGRELAVQYALEGAPTLGLIGRREYQLEEVAGACRDRGAAVHTYAIDVRDGEAVRAMAERFVAEAGGVDLVIANAGVGGDDRLEEGDPSRATWIIDVNVNGVINTIVPFVPAMKRQGSGQVVAVASVAGFRALPLRTTYSASKIAVRTLMEGYGLTLGKHGITCTAINPGFIKSELTENNEFPMPFLLDTAPAAERIRKAIRRRRTVYTFPLPMAVAARGLALAPRWIVRKLR